MSWNQLPSGVPTDQVGGGDAHRIELHLAEVRIADAVGDGVNPHACARHVDDELGEAVVPVVRLHRCGRRR